MTIVGLADKVLTGSGKRPSFLVRWFLGAWAVSGMVFWLATDKMAPSNVPLVQTVRADCEKQTGKPIRWTACDAGALWEYPKFYPWLYGLEVLVPIVDFQQSRFWQPVSRDGWYGFLTFLYRCIASAFGWLLGVALVSLATRYFKEPTEAGTSEGLAKSGSPASRTQ
jgi:hypothetical protein